MNTWEISLNLFALSCSHGGHKEQKNLICHVPRAIWVSFVVWENFESFQKRDSGAKFLQARACPVGTTVPSVAICLVQTTSPVLLGGGRWVFFLDIGRKDLLSEFQDSFSCFVPSALIANPLAVDFVVEKSILSWATRCPVDACVHLSEHPVGREAWQLLNRQDWWSGQTAYK